MVGREATDYEKLAWVTAYLLQPWSEEKLSVNRLLGRPDGSPEAIEAMIGGSQDGNALYDRAMKRQRDSQDGPQHARQWYPPDTGGDTLKRQRGE